MDNKKIPTGVGTIIILIIALTIGVFILRYEKIKYTERVASGNLSELCMKNNSDILFRETKNEALINDCSKEYSIPEKHLLEFLEKNEDELKREKSITKEYAVYHNDEYGYTAKYPSGWMMDTKKEASFYEKTLSGLNKYYPGFHGIPSKINDKGINGDYYINISVKNIGKGKTLREWKNNASYKYEKMVIGDKLVLAFKEAMNSYNQGIKYYYFVNYEKGDAYTVRVNYKDYMGEIGEIVISTLEFD